MTNQERQHQNSVPGELEALLPHDGTGHALPPIVNEWIDRIHTARAIHGKLCIRGGGTKDFYGGPPRGERLDTYQLKGITQYEPSELVVTVRGGTLLAELEAALAEHGQYLPFEPPRFDKGGTVGGMVAAGLSGPARASVGCVRDHVLGATLLTGRGELLSFGGQVMKNVAGYDVSRLLAGSLGTLGILCEVSLKVMPVMPATASLRFEMSQGDALDTLQAWGAQPLPVNASVWWDDTLVVRLAGAQAAVEAAAQKLGGERLDERIAAPFWAGLRDQQDEFFVGARRAVSGGAALWRVSVPSATPPLDLSGEQLIEWGGAQRWVCTSTPAQQLRETAAKAGGHATLFMGSDKRVGAFAPLSAPLERIHKELKKAFDPEGVFNVGRMYGGW